MIAKFDDSPTTQLAVSSRIAKLQAQRSAVYVPVDIDVRIWREICDFFPDSGAGINYQTIELNGECRQIIVAFILSTLQDRERQFSFSQKVQDRMSVVGHRKRKKIVKYFKRSQFFRVAIDYSVDHHSKIRTVKGARLMPVDADQHKVMGPRVRGLGSVLPCSPSLVLDPVALPALRLPDVLWRFSGSTVRVLLSVNWYRRYGQSFRDASSAMFPDQWQFVGCVEKSLKQCVFTIPTMQSLEKLAKTRKTKSGKRAPETPLSDDEWAQLTLERWIDCCIDPLLYLHRVELRLYYPLVSQCKHLRHEHLRFMFNGKIEPMAEVDMSATFWVLLTSMLHDSPCKDRLIADQNAGSFYSRLNEASGSEYTDLGELKIAVQRDCLFGRKDFGKSRLFLVMMDIYPDLAKFILDRRNRHTVTWMSNLLTNAEGAFFIDCLLPYVVKAGIPALPIHDCLCVPASVAAQVRDWCCKLAKERFGFEPHFKLQTFGMSA
jgi:hypothetical protein